MTKLQKAFLSFNETITLSDSKRDNLVTSRDALKDVIKKWFDTHHPECKPEFKVQGSFAMKTTLMQLEGEEYDIDLGIYLSGYECTNQNEYPSPHTVHEWINEATKDQTKEENINKMTCIRVIYKNDYHVDLPSYIKDANDNILLSHTRDGWVLSDPVEFTNWFLLHVSQYGEQLRRLVKYIKAWKDYRKMPLASIGITILVCNNFVGSEGEDYKSLYETLKSINNKLSYSFNCNKPVTPFENIFEDYSDTRKQTVINGLKDFEQRMGIVINDNDCEIKKKNLLKLFGDRFVISCDEKFEKTEKPGILKSDGRSA